MQEIIMKFIDRVLVQTFWWIGQPELAALNIGCLALVGAVIAKQYLLAAAIGIIGLIYAVTNATSGASLGGF